MFDHVGVNVSDLEKSKSFYEQTLEPLGYAVKMEFEGAAGFGAQDWIPPFWIRQGEKSGPVHVAFSTDREGVDAFYQAAIDAGGRDNGPPGVRADYHEHYYAAFVHDPDGNNVEAVCHSPA